MPYNLFILFISFPFLVKKLHEFKVAFKVSIEFFISRMFFSLSIKGFDIELYIFSAVCFAIKGNIFSKLLFRHKFNSSLKAFLRWFAIYREVIWLILALVEEELEEKLLKLSLNDLGRPNGFWLKWGLVDGPGNEDWESGIILWEQKISWGSYPPWNMEFVNIF